MLPQPTAVTPTKIGVGIDTSRYGHYAAFLRDDLNAAAGELQFVESAAGYAQLRQRFEAIVAKHGHVHFLIRLDAAGQYADNLLHFLHSLASSFGVTISCGDPQRNKNYRAALLPKGWEESPGGGGGAVPANDLVDSTMPGRIFLEIQSQTADTIRVTSRPFAKDCQCSLYPLSSRSCFCNHRKKSTWALQT
jgi:hypothetical protein